MESVGDIKFKAARKRNLRQRLAASDDEEADRTSDGEAPAIASES